MLELQTQMDSVLAKRNLRGHCVAAESHRHLAYYDIELEAATPVRRIESAAREIGMDLRSKTTPIVKVMSDLGVVRLQVAMKTAEKMDLYKLLSNEKVPDGYIVPLLLGETDDGKKFWTDLNKHPHTLIAGSTGSGKSVLLHNIICNLIIMSELKMRDPIIYLVDPKGCEFPVYGNDFHHSIAGIETTYFGTISLLESLVEEMNYRFDVMRQVGINSIEERLLFSPIVLIVDEVNDLMLQDRSHRGSDKGRFQKLVIQLAQKSRAAGIYLIMATQRPSTDVLTGTIKANFPARIACRVATQTDSRVILDHNGAENLLGRGDALLSNMEHDSVRLQVAYADARSTLEYVKYCRQFFAW